MKRIWIVGATGHVGSALKGMLDLLQYEIFETDKNEVDVTDREQVHGYAIMNHPNIIINCAGYTDIVACEKNPDEAFNVNALGARNLAIAAQEIEAKLIQLSTDDVFTLSPNRPINEFDHTQPMTVYGKSKLAGEVLVERLCTQFVIVRSSWVYGTGKDFVDEVLSAVGTQKTFEASVNAWASPTSAKELAKVLVQFIEKDCLGIYHAVCQGKCNRYEFAKEILKAAGKEQEIEIIPVETRGELRPEYSVLDNMMLRIEGLEQPKNWKEALHEYILATGGIE